MARARKNRGHLPEETASIYKMFLAPPNHEGGDRRQVVLLDSRFLVRDTERVSYPSTVIRIGLVAVVDVANLDDLVGIAHVAGGVVEQSLLRVGRHKTEQFTRLFVVVIVVRAEVPA